MSKLIVSSRYGTTPNEILNSKELSLKAKGMYGFLQCKPDNWNFSTERIASQIKESEKVVRSTLQELERFGLLTRKLRPKDISGKWTGYEYRLHELITDIPKPSLPKATGWENDRMDTRGDISNKDYSKQDIVIKRESTPSQIAKDFFNNIESEHRINNFNNLVEKGFSEEIVRTEMLKFISYWTEPDKNGKRQRWEKQDVFEITRRLATWFSKSNNFNKSKTINSI